MVIVSFGSGLKRSADFFVVDDALLVIVAASQFALGKEIIKHLAAWHG